MDVITSITDLFGRVFAPLTGLVGEALEFFYSFGAPWWLSIVILTVIVRTLLFPLTVRQVKSMRAMQDLKPQMDKIRAKYKDNKQKQQEEIMKLYQESGVNPFGSCLPLLVQLPIFITMFYVIKDFGYTHPDFTSGGILWFQDLSIQDPYYVLPILSAVTMLAASEITSKHIDPQQRWLMRILPVVFTVFLLTFPAGLFMYWITSNLVTLAQNYVIYNHGPGRRPPPEHARSGGFGGAGGPAEAGNGADNSRRRGQKANGGGTNRQTVSSEGGDGAAAQAATTAKRKRRRKKKR
jgi:YidC/Oxa1 family membrane protein insertase